MLGGGYKFNRHFSMLGEYQFNSNNIPAKVLQQVGEPGGHIHIWSLTVDPVWNYQDRRHVGRICDGWWRLLQEDHIVHAPAIITSYYCDYFYCYPYQYVRQRSGERSSLTMPAA